MFAAYALGCLLTTQSTTWISGTVTYRQKIAIPASARLHLSIDRFEGSNQTTVSEISILTRGKQVPLEFSMAFFLAETDKKAKFGLKAKIVDGDKVLFHNPEIFWVQPGQKKADLVVSQPQTYSSSNIEDIVWYLDQLGTKKPVPSAQRPSIRLNSKDGTTNGHTGVNGFGGTYSLRNTVFSFQPGPMTMMAGTPEQMEIERSFIDALSKGKALKLKGTILQLWDSERIVATFRSK